MPVLLDRWAQSISYDKAILVGNGHTQCAAPAGAAELIAPGRAGASAGVACRARYPAPLQLVLAQVAQRSQEAGMAQKMTVEL
jgi:hypothetical protein